MKNEKLTYNLVLFTNNGKELASWVVSKHSIFDDRLTDLRKLVFEAIQVFQDKLGGKK